VQGQTYFHVPTLEFSATFNENWSRAEFQGDGSRANNLKHVTTWHTDGFNISVAISGGAELGFSGTKESVSWETEADNTDVMVHEWDTVKFTAGPFGAIYRVHYDLSAVFQYGSSFYGITAYSSRIV